MRKKWCRAAEAVFCMILFVGCGNHKGVSEEEAYIGETGDETYMEEMEQKQEEHFLPAKEDEDVPLVVSEYAEEAEYPRLAAFLSSYYDIPEEYQMKTRYYYNYVDLNGDSMDEIFAIVVGDYTKVPFGDPAVILTETDGGFAVIESFEGIHTPVLISEELTSGWHDIIYNEYGRGAEDGYRICRYNPEGGYQTALSEVLDELQPTGGTQILANNFIDDMDKGRYLTLAPQEKVQITE